MLNAFEFAPPRVIFGEGSVAKVGGEAAKYGKKALVVTYDENKVTEEISKDIKLITSFVDELDLDNDLFRKEV